MYLLQLAGRLCTNGKSLHHLKTMGGGLLNPQPMKWYISPIELSKPVKLPIKYF
jgi:hypothetical protein